MFVLGNFTGAAGQSLPWKIECDVLTRDDWDCVAAVCAPSLPKFKEVWGVPRGGLLFADALAKYRFTRPVIGLLPLIVDDVWTTGHSMCTFAEERLGLRPHQWHGLVAFSRAPTLPEGVRCFMKRDL